MPQYIGSSALLAGDETYTSPWVNTNRWASISGSIFADQAGTLYVEQSGDGVNADISASHSATADTGAGYSETLLLPYVRLRFTNGGSDQAVFRLFSRFIAGEST